MLFRFLAILCMIAVGQIQADPGPEKNNTTNSTPPHSPVTNVALSINGNSNSTGKPLINAPLVFPQKGFTTLNETLEKLPSNFTSKTITTESALNKTTLFIKSSETSKKTELNSVTPNELEETTKKSPSIKPTDTEVSDLENVPTKNPNDIDLLPVSPKIVYTDRKDPDERVILIDNGENTEDVIKAQKSVYQEPHVALVQGQMAAILAGVFLCISVVGYVAMLSWRRYLENRYGNREMLVNEFEFDEREDMKYFSI